MSGPAVPAHPPDQSGSGWAAAAVTDPPTARAKVSGVGGVS